MTSDTKSKIIKAALKAFAQYGIEKASLRRISSEAGVNIAAVNYHFGSKDNLLREIFVSLVRPLDQDRDRLLAEARIRAGDGPLAVEDLARSFIIPMFEFRRRYPEYISVFGHFYGRRESRDNHLRFLISDKAKEAYTLFTDEICRSRPEVPREKMLKRVNLAVAMAASFIINSWLIESLEELSGVKITEETLVQQVAAFIKDGI